ncbi:MAG: DMT family transporter [Bdellovibrionales bacterium]
MVWLIALGAGLASVIQGGLNRQLGRNWDLASVVFLNGAVFVICAGLYWLWQREQVNAGSWSWWAVIPGMLGFLFVLAVPFAISRLGAMSVFICLIAAQIVGGLVWDLMVEGLSPSPYKWAGAALAAMGALIMSRS